MPNLFLNKMSKPTAVGDLVLTDGNILVGNASNKATGVTMSGDATIINTGVMTLISTVVMNDQANTYSGAGTQDFAGATLDNVAILNSNAAALPSSVNPLFYRRLPPS